MRKIAVYSSIILCSLSLGIHAEELEQDKGQAEAPQLDQQDDLSSSHQASEQVKGKLIKDAELPQMQIFTSSSN